MTDAIDFAKVEGALRESHNELKGTIETISKSVDAYGSGLTDQKSAIEGLSAKSTEMADRLHDMEQKSFGSKEESRIVTLGEQFVKSDGFAAMVVRNQNSARIDVKSAIINANGDNQPLVAAERLPGIQFEPNRPLRIRDILPATGTSSNLIEYAKENVFTNAAAIQATENSTKAESGLTFTRATTEVQTLAHWIPVSKQILSDAPQLQGYINGRMQYGLKLVEEEQLLNGDATSGNLNGLLNQATDYVAVSGFTSNFDVLHCAITQAQLSHYLPNAVAMHPTDVRNLNLVKNSNGDYIAANPRSSVMDVAWGLPVVVSSTIPAGTFLVGAFDMGAQIFDREESSIQLSLENSDNFVKNMATILAEERIALAVYRPAAFIKGSFA
tara:strand:+ start:591 stop:1745 length:1155 start_codon:yes stop_codon:yes gene_type:complete